MPQRRYSSQPITDNENAAVGDALASHCRHHGRCCRHSAWPHPASRPFIAVVGTSPPARDPFASHRRSRRKRHGRHGCLHRRAFTTRRAASRTPRSHRHARCRHCRPTATHPAATIAIMARNRNLPRAFHRHDRTSILSLCGSLTSCLLVSAAAADENHFRKAAAIAVLANAETPFSRYRQESHRPWPSQPCRAIRNRRHKRH